MTAAHRGRQPRHRVPAQPQAPAVPARDRPQGHQHRAHRAASGRCATSPSPSSEGEAVGLVGANGCGKSTLLQLLAGVILPDEGDVGVHAGVAPLIELTGGFVPELTARDNIWLTAGLHGLARRPDRGAVRRHRRVRRDRRLPGHAVPALLQRHAGAARLLGRDPAGRADHPGRRGPGGGGQALPREVLHRGWSSIVSDGRTLFLVSHNEADLRRFCTPRALPAARAS